MESVFHGDSFKGDSRNKELDVTIQDQPVTPELTKDQPAEAPETPELLFDITQIENDQSRLPDADQTRFNHYSLNTSEDGQFHESPAVDVTADATVMFEANPMYKSGNITYEEQKINMAINKNSSNIF